jgi:hypothetical protein
LHYGGWRLKSARLCDVLATPGISSISMEIVSVKIINPNREIKSGRAAGDAFIFKFNKNNNLSKYKSSSASPADGFVDAPHFRF